MNLKLTIFPDEVLTRYEALGVAPYAGFINPVYQPIEKEGELIDVEITYPADFLQQMLEYGKKKINTEGIDLQQALLGLG